MEKEVYNMQNDNNSMDDAIELVLCLCVIIIVFITFNIYIVTFYTVHNLILACTYLS